MSYLMAIGMETLYMGIIVFIVSNLIGNKLANKLVNKYMFNIEKNSYYYHLGRQFFTVGIMCPLMSLIASLLFNYSSINNILITWVLTYYKNIPIAFFWNMYFAGPITNKLFN
jgi:uncharacterized membrane protein